jgi:hypothetical protein
MALIALAADKGAPGVTTGSVALAAVWPRPVLLAECDPAGGDICYWLPGTDGHRLDPGRGMLSLAVAARHGLQPEQLWTHTQKLRGGLDVLAGVSTAEQGAGLGSLWGPAGAAFAALAEADVIADCGRLGPDGPHYDLLAHASAVILVTRPSVGDVIRLRDRVSVLSTALRRRGRSGTGVGIIVVADRRHFSEALAEVARAVDHGAGSARVIGGLAHEPRSAEQLRGEWGRKLDGSLLIRSARELAAELVSVLPAVSPAEPGVPPPPATSSVVPAGHPDEQALASVPQPAAGWPGEHDLLPAPPQPPDRPRGRGRHADPAGPPGDQRELNGHRQLPPEPGALLPPQPGQPPGGGW